MRIHSAMLDRTRVGVEKDLAAGLRARRMGKYDPLERYLRRRGDEEFELSFSEIGRILGGPLPNSASRPQWWANESASNSRHVQRRAWHNAGYDAFLLPRDRVFFRRPAS